MKLSLRQCRWFRLCRSGLVEPFADAVEAARALNGIQAQILPAAALALYNRTPALDFDGFGEALWTQRELVKIWAQRGTLHLYPSVDWALVTGAQQEHRSWWERKTEKDGGDVEQFRATVEAVAVELESRGTLTRSDLRSGDIEISSFLLSSWGGIFHDLVRRGLACHGPSEGNEGVFVHRKHWLPQLDWSLPSVEHSNQMLARRYFQTYGPSTVQDFAYWRGTNQRNAKRWCEGIADELIEVDVNGSSMLLLREDKDIARERPPAREEWPLRMLARFDPFLLAHKDKQWLLHARHYDEVWRPAGHIEATLLQEGRIIGTWRYDRNAQDCAMTIRPFAALPEHIEDEIMELSAGVASFFGLPLREVLFEIPE